MVPYDEVISKAINVSLPETNFGLFSNAKWVIQVRIGNKPDCKENP